MIFVYLDWNVISQIKAGYHEQLKYIIKQHNRIITPFSTSHISDLFASYTNDSEQLKIIEEDLNYISFLTKDYCLFNDGQEIKLYEDDPKRLFDQRIAEKDLFKNFNLDTIFEVSKNDQTLTEFSNSLVNLIKSIPLDKPFIDALSNPESSEILNNMFPGLRDNPTMEGFFNSMGKMLANLNEGEGYKDLREIIQSGLQIKRDQFFNADDPYEKIDKAYEKFGINDLSPYQPMDKSGPKWFNEITNEYLMLDMHGYQEDRVKVGKGRKETFSNTTEDSFHAAFASMCNFYIINDKRSFNKTNQVYKKLELNTLVFKPQEFVEYYELYLKSRPYTIDLKIPFKYLEFDNYSEQTSGDNTLRTYHLPHFLFDFFNKMTVLLNREKKMELIVLGQFKPSNKTYTFHFEVINLYPRLIEALGEDADKFGEIRYTELISEEWRGRRWEFESITFKLTRKNGRYQLYYYFN